MQHLSNIYNPTLPDAQEKHIKYIQAFGEPMGPELQWEQHLEWVGKNVIGRPKATEKHTVEELEIMGMVGVYSIGKQ